MKKKIVILLSVLIISFNLVGCIGKAKVSVKTTKFKIIDVSTNNYGAVLLLLDEDNNRITAQNIDNSYNFNCDFEIKTKDDLIGKYYYGDAYSAFKQDTVIKSK